jgi:ribosomal protein S19
MPIFMVNKAFWVHKGMHFRKKRIEYYHMAIPMGAFTLTRKPFTPPVKRIKKKLRKKRFGKIKYE